MPQADLHFAPQPNLGQQGCPPAAHRGSYVLSSHRALCLLLCVCVMRLNALGRGKCLICIQPCSKKREK